MNVAEKGVVEPSQRYFATPSEMAKELFFYVTRCGDYTLSRDYHFHFQSEIGQMESHYRSFMLFALLKGEMKVRAGEHQYTVSAGECTLFDCREPHEYQPVGGDATFLWLHFDGVSARRFYEYILRVHRKPPFALPYDGFADDLRSLIRGTNHYSEAKRSQMIYRLLSSLAVSPTPDGNVQNVSVGAAVEYMEQHLFENLSVREIAAQIHMSPSHFSRLFRQQTGYAPHEYLVVRRIDHAKYLLCSTGLTVRQIAFQSGYNSEGNFIKSFVDKVGVTPSRFRAEMT